MNYTDMETEEKDRQALGTFKKLLGLEHFGWKFGAIMVLICSVIFIIVSIVSIVLGASVPQGQTSVDLVGVGGIVVGVVYLCVSLTALLPVAIICFIMIKKVEYYQSTIDTDINIARKRCTSVGMMIFCIIFNNIAAIFFIINFVKTKANAESFDRIEARQKA